MIRCDFYLRFHGQRRGCTSRMWRICFGALWIDTLWNGVDEKQLLIDTVAHIQPPTLPLFPEGPPNRRADASPESLRQNSFRSWCCPGPGSAPGGPGQHKKPPRGSSENVLAVTKAFYTLAKIRTSNSIHKRLLFNRHLISMCSENQGLRETSEISPRPSPLICH